jgi:Cys-tRNA(Pro) deacylase
MRRSGVPSGAMGIMSDTNAIKWLRTQDVAFEPLPYEFTDIGADHAAEAVGKPLEMVCKTLIVEATGKNYYVAIVPGDQRFDPYMMAKAIGAKDVEMAGQQDAEKITGYHVGGISPFATRRHLPVIIEESLLALDRIIVNGGRRGMLVELDTDDLVRLLDAKPANICR